MPEHLYRIYILLILLAGLLAKLYPQKQPQRFDEFQPVPGLPSKLATSVFKDSRGFMWFGTENGLYRWDGYEFAEFHHDSGDSASISSNFIWSIFEDNKGNLWIGTLSDGLNIYNPHTDKFKRYSRPPDYRFDFDFNNIRGGMQDKAGNTWLVSSTTSGLVRFDENTGEFEIFRPRQDSMASFANMITSLLEDSRGNFWVGTAHGLLLLNKETKIFTNLDSLVELPSMLNRFTVNGISEDSEGILWIGSDHGMVRYDPVSNQVMNYRHDENNPNTLCSDDIMAFYDDPSDPCHFLWVMTYTCGFNKLDKLTGNVIHYSGPPDDPTSHAFDGMFDLYLDDHGMLWACTGFAGAVRYNLAERPFHHYKVGPFKNMPYEYDATVFLDGRDGSFWVGTANAGLLKYDPEMNLSAHYTWNPDNPDDPGHLSYRYVFSLLEDSDNILWIGTATSLDALDQAQDRILHVKFQGDYDFPLVRVNEIIEDSRKTIWIASNMGVYFVQKNYPLDTLFSKLPSFSSNPMENRCVAEDCEGNIWFGTYGQGLFRLSPENRKDFNFINYRNDPNDNSSISDDNITALFTGSDGAVWCGTTNGLNRYDRTRDAFQRFNQINGLDASFIYDILDDDLGNLWLSTEKGILRFTPAYGSTGRSRLLERQDGIPFDDNYQFKIYRAKNGKIYIGGRRLAGDGYYCFDPDSLNENRHVPEMALTELLVRNKPFRLDSSVSTIMKLHLKHNQNYFSLKFAALDYVNPAKNMYAYMLEGFDEDWIYSGTRRMASYTNVSPGTYIFRYKGSNNDGLWNETGGSLFITVASPPWKTWWAYGLYVILSASVIILTVRFYLNRQKLVHNLQMKQIEAEKLEEVNREKSRFFANISHEFRTPLTLIIGPVNRAVSLIREEHILQDLKMSLRNAYRLQNLINQLLSLAKIESGALKLQARQENITDLVRGYFQSFESAAREKNIELVFQSDQPDIQVYIDRDKMEKILYNLLSNAFKFTGDGGRIIVAVDNRQSKVSISVTDTGAGISPENLLRIFDRFYQVNDTMTREQEGTGIGLALVKELVELHYGKISVESEIGKGTTFTVLLPMGRGHLKEEERRGEEVKRRSGEEVKRGDITNFLNRTLEPETQNPESETRNPEPGTDKPLLLVVEDNTDMRLYLRNCLGDIYTILDASDGEQGLSKAMEAIPDLVITDVMMPKMDGYELCRRLKSDEKTSHIPVILLTARTTLESKIEGLETGADDFVSKPFDALELLVRVRNLVEQRKKLTEKLMRNAGRLGLTSILDLPGSGMDSMEEKFLKKSLGIIHQNLADPDFSVEQFSGLMAMSRSQLYRKITALTGLSPNEFIRYTRLQKAAEMLAHRTANVAGIAYDVGFNNPSYFAECFKKQFGVLPSEYTSENS